MRIDSSRLAAIMDAKGVTCGEVKTTPWGKSSKDGCWYRRFRGIRLKAGFDGGPSEDLIGFQLIDDDGGTAPKDEIQYLIPGWVPTLAEAKHLAEETVKELLKPTADSESTPSASDEKTNSTADENHVF